MQRWICRENTILKKKRLSLELDLASHTHAKLAAFLLFFKFRTLNSRGIDFIIEPAAALTVVFNPEPELLACVRRTQSLHRPHTHLN